MAKPFHPARTLFSALFLLALFGYMLSRKPPPEPHPKFKGTTFGSVAFKILTADANLNRVEKNQLGLAFSRELDAVNHQMSTWREDSEISRFNRTKRTEWIEISSDFAKVVQAALRFAEETGGAFDPTTGVLKRQYNYGPDAGQAKTDPAPPRGYTLLEQQGTRIRKTDPQLTLDLDAIAKGYAVDRVSEVLVEHGVTNHLVEIGGEIRTRGINPHGDPWGVFIEVPKAGAGMYQKLEVPDIAVATSGNAYQSRHIINPSTGTAVTNALRSVTVLAPSCLEADALATGYFVMGREAGHAHAEARRETEAMFLYVREGVLEELKTSGFPE